MFDLKYSLAITSAVLAVIACYYCLQTYHLRASLAEAKAQVEIWQDRVNQQNKAIEQWQKESQSLEDKIKKTQAEADKTRQKALDDASKSMQADVPKDCEKAMKWLIQQAHT